MATIIKKTRNYTYQGSAKNPIRISNTLIRANKRPTICAPSDNTWYHPNRSYRSMVILSDGNSKVADLADKLRGLYGRKVYQRSYGKSTILSCPFASNCVKFCYQNLNNYTASMRMHGHNYHQVYTRSRVAIRKVIQAAIDANKIDIVRLNDNGDFMSLAEILAWLDVALENPSIIFYGYTKNTPHLYKARQQFGQFPSNFRVSISDLSENDATMEKYMRQIRSEFPGEFRVCHIIDTPERDELYSQLPWNDTEIQAYCYTSDFKIALHVGVSQRQFCNDAELEVNDKYAGGFTSDGIAYC